MSYWPRRNVRCTRSPDGEDEETRWRSHNNAHVVFKPVLQFLQYANFSFGCRSSDHFGRNCDLFSSVFFDNFASASGLHILIGSSSGDTTVTPSQKPTEQYQNRAKKKKHKNGFVRKSTSQVNFFIYNQNVRMIAKLKHIVHGACVFVSARGDCSAPQLISRKFKFFKRRQPSLFGNESFRWWYPTIATTQHSHMNLCCYWCRCCCYFFHFHKSTDRPRRFLLLMSIICCVSVKIPSHMVDRRCETFRIPHHIWCVLLIRNFIDKSIGEN